MERLKLKANAKINLILSVIGRLDNGYHKIDTVMQSVNLGDIITVKKAREISVGCKISGLNNKENIAYRAAEAFFAETQISGGAEIFIEKHIPLSAGLGGGSADAAAVLCGLNRLYSAALSNGELCRIAAHLGADVPFFINGGTARARGIGEKIEALNPLEKCVFLLVKDGNKLSTAEMYRRLDAAEYIRPDVDGFTDVLNKNGIERAAKYIGNSFSVLWQSDIERRLYNLGASAVSLSGSGPYRFALFKDENAAKAAETELSVCGTESFLVENINRSVIFE